MRASRLAVCLLMCSFGSGVIACSGSDQSTIPGHHAHQRTTQWRSTKDDPPPSVPWLISPRAETVAGSSRTTASVPSAVAV